MQIVHIRSLQSGQLRSTLFTLVQMYEVQFQAFYRVLARCQSPCRGLPSLTFPESIKYYSPLLDAAHLLWLALGWHLQATMTLAFGNVAFLLGFHEKHNPLDQAVHTLQARSSPPLACSPNTSARDRRYTLGN